MLAFRADKPLIKPGDLVRTNDRARTATVLEVRAGGFRLLEDVATRERYTRHVSSLYLVRSALPQPWPSRRA